MVQIYCTVQQACFLCVLGVLCGEARRALRIIGLPPASSLAPGMGQPRHRRRDRGHLSAAAVLPDARAGRGRRVARHHRRRGRSGQQRAEDRGGPAGGPVAAKRPLVLLGYSVSSFARPFIALATDVDAGVRGARARSRRQGRPQRAARCDARGVGDADDARKDLRLPSGRWTTSAPSSAPRSRRCSCSSIPEQYRTLFALTIVPGAIAVALIFLLPDEDKNEHVASGRSTAGVASGFSRTSTAARPRPRRSHARSPPSCWSSRCSRSATRPTRSCCCKLTDAAGGVRYVPLMWAGLHVVKAVVSMSAGAGPTASGAAR